MELINEPTQSLSSKAQGIESIRNGMSDFTKETIQRKNEVTRFMLFLYFSKIQNVEDLESLLLKVVGALNLPF